MQPREAREYGTMRREHIQMENSLENRLDLKYSILLLRKMPFKGFFNAHIFSPALRFMFPIYWNPFQYTDCLHIYLLLRWHEFKLYFLLTKISCLLW